MAGPTSGDDALFGTTGPDVIDGLEGKDQIQGGGGNDTIHGGPGNDWLRGDEDNDSVYGDDGDDLIFADRGNDLIDGGAGFDTLTFELGAVAHVDLSITGPQDIGGFGIDTIIGIEKIIGTQFDDILIGDSGANEFVGNGGFDILKGGGGDDRLHGNGTLEGGAGNDILELGGGNNVIVFTAGDDHDDVFQSLGQVQVQVHGYSEYQSLTQVGADVVVTFSAGDTITFHQMPVELVQNALLFMDTTDGTIRGGPNSDTLAGDDNDNSIYGFGGSDFLTGNGGNDYLSGGDGDDSLNGGAGNDTLDGGNGNDKFFGGDGFDTVTYASAASGVQANLANGDRFLDRIERLYGSAFNDILTGNDLANEIGGGFGADTLTGGGGADTFRDTAAGLNGDRITDFGADDRIVISDATLAGFTYQLSGQTLTYTGGSLTFDKPLASSVMVSAAAEGGVQITLSPFAQFHSVDPFDVNTVNLNWYYANLVGATLKKNVNVTFDGTVYPDAFGVIANDGSSSLELDFLGSGFAVDVNGAITAGTVNVVSEFNLIGSYSRWSAEGVSVSAVALYNAALTPSNQDDINLIQLALSGNNVIALSSGNDRMSGYAGDDVITGGLGADILSGGSGNDIFFDTRAGLSGDTITDLESADRIVITDADIGTFSFGLSGHTLTFSGGSLTLTNLPSGHIVAHAVAAGGVELSIVERVPHAAHNDFNGDGRSDVLWLNDNGTVRDWLGQSNGTFAGNIANVNFLSAAGSHIAGTGDFDGDGRVDVLWQTFDGVVVDMLGHFDGFIDNSAKVNIRTGTEWHIIGTADFNGDGRDDVLLQNTNGTVREWLGQADGTFTGNIANVNFLAGAGSRVVGTGDFNGDGYADTLWQTNDGLVTDLLGTASGGFIDNYLKVAIRTGVEWHAIGTGDFNGDGRDDILWKKDNGTVREWLGQADGTFTGNIDHVNFLAGANSHVVAIGDFNGDGYADTLWQTNDGLVTDLLGTASGGFIDNYTKVAIYTGADWHAQEPFVHDLLG